MTLWGLVAKVSWVNFYLKRQSFLQHFTNCVWLSGKTNNCSSSEERRQKESENCTKAKKA